VPRQAPQTRAGSRPTRNAELAAWAARDADAVFLDCGAALLPGGKVRSRGITPLIFSEALFL